MLKACCTLPVIAFSLVCFAKPRVMEQVKQRIQDKVSAPDGRPTRADDGWPILYNLPLYTRKNTPVMQQHFVSRKEDGTYLTYVCTSYSDDEMHKFGGPNCYLVDPKTGIHYKALRSIPAEAWDYFHLVGMAGKTWTVTVVFPPLPKEVEKVEYYGVTHHLQCEELHDLNNLVIQVNRYEK